MTVAWAAVVLALCGAAKAQLRNPLPEFSETGHQLPTTIQPPPRAWNLEYLDLAVLAAALWLAVMLAHRWRSRKGIWALTMFSLLYFGFYRKGCVCAIGAIQNIALAIAQPGQYAVPLTVLGFFLLPLLFAMLHGRVFCSGVCPLGAAQDVALISPLKLPTWLSAPLRIGAYVYLIAAVLLAGLGSAFVICQYDPFVSFFRLGGSMSMVLLGAAVLVLATVVARPYCRFACPLGVLLGHASRVSRQSVKITPEDCITCRLCEDSCPVQAIHAPAPTRPAPKPVDKFLLAVLIVQLPVLVAAGVFVGAKGGTLLAQNDATVLLAQRIHLEQAQQVDGTTNESQAFWRSGRDAQDLYRQADAIYRNTSLGAEIAGGILGAILGLKLISLSLRRRREDFAADKAHCIACGRCFEYCPQKTVSSFRTCLTGRQAVPAVTINNTTPPTQATMGTATRLRSDDELRRAPIPWFRAAIMTAAVAAAFCAVIIVVLINDWRHMQAVDVINSPQLAAMTLELSANRKDQALRERIRQLDEQLRHDQATYLWRLDRGRYMLAAGLGVLVLAIQLARRARKAVPNPQPQPVTSPAISTRRWAQVSLVLVAAGAVAAVAWAAGGPEGKRLSAQRAWIQAAARQAVPQAVADFATDSELQAVWPGFRGYGGLGVSPARNVPTDWDGPSKRNILWSTPIELKGASSPVVFGGKVFLSSADERRRDVWCFDANSGKVLWRQQVGRPGAGMPKLHNKASLADPTMATDGRHVFAIFATGELAALDMEGKLLWSKSLGTPDGGEYGYSNSLITYRRLLCVQYDQNAEAKDGRSALLGIEAATGKVLYNIVRPISKSWASPAMVHVGDHDELVTFAQPLVIAYDPLSGQELWRAKVLPNDADVAPSPAAADGKVVIAQANGCLAVMPAGLRGDITDKAVIAQPQTLPEIASPLAFAGKVLLVDANGYIAAIDLARPGDDPLAEIHVTDKSFSSSPVLADGRVYLFGDSGDCHILKLDGSQLKEIARCKLGEPVLTTPAILDGRIYIRGERHLFCIGGKQ